MSLELFVRGLYTRTAVARHPPDHIYNWLVDFFARHSHCTPFCDHTSEFESVTVSITER